MTATTQRSVTVPVPVLPMVRHLEGCPVPLHPEDAEMAARVSTYAVSGTGLDTRNRDDRGGGERTIATHCVECGAISYHKER